MADEAKMVIELVDRSGSSGAASAGASAPGAAQVPGASIAEDFNRRISERGAGSVVPPPTPGPVVGDPLIGSIRQMYEADKNVTPDELAKFFGLSADKAASLLNAARNGGGDVPPPPTTSAPAAPIPNSPLPSTYTPSAERAEGTASVNRTDGRETDPFTGAFVDRPRSQSGYEGLQPGGTRAEGNRSTRPLGTRDPLTGEYDYLDSPEIVGPEPVDERIASFSDRVRESFLNPTAKKARDYDRYLDSLTEAKEANQLTEEEFNQAAKQARLALDGGEGGGGLGSLLGRAAPFLGQFGGRFGAAVGNLGSTVTGAAETLGLGAAAGEAGAGLGGLGALGGLAGIAGPAGLAAALIAASAAVPAAALSYAASQAERARGQIRDIDPAVALAEAQADLRQFEANRRTSNRLGDEVADYINQTSRARIAFQETQDIISEPLIRDLNDGLVTVAAGLEVLNNLIGNGAFEAFYEGLRDVSFPLVGSLKDLAKLLKEQQGQSDSPITWMDDNPHLDPPPPFHVGSEAPASFNVAPMPGLNF